MKLDPILQKQLQWRFQRENRKILFITRAKMFIHLQGSEWQENSAGLLIFYSREGSYYFTIVNVMTFQINFDFQLYTNFTSYCKFLGDQKCLIFLVPLNSKTLKFMLVLQSKTQLAELKRDLDKIFAPVQGNSDQLDFLSRPEVIDIFKRAQIDETIIAADLTFREQVQNEVKQFFEQINTKKQNKVKTGFKSYALGRDQWKLEAQEINFMKQKLLQSLADTLNHLQKQARIRMNKK